LHLKTQHDVAKTFVGIVKAPESGTITVGIANEQDGSVTGWSLPVENTELSDYYAVQPDGRPSFEMPPDLGSLAQYLRNELGESPDVSFLIEVPEALPHPPNDPYGIPHPILATDSVVLKVLVLLGVLGYVATPFQVNSERGLAVVFPILPDSELAHLRTISPRYLRHGTCKAYAELLSLSCEQPEHIAIVGALIAKNTGAFHYWSSIGRVQSSHDVVQDLRAGRGTRVHSAREEYILEFTGATRRDEIEDLPLEYAVASKRYEHLGPNDAIKAALIHVCKEWGIVLRCRSRRPDAEDPEAIGGVYPLPGMFESIILHALQQAERERIWPGM
jgi:hypothetical protein